MTADEFRILALLGPESVEDEHMGHPDFRVSKKVFASLGPDLDWAMVKLTPEQQRLFVQSEPHVFQPMTGAWGARGYTKVILKLASEPSVRQALELAWRNTAAKTLLDEERFGT